MCSLTRTIYVCLHSGDTHPPSGRKIRICAFQSTPRERLSGHMTSLKISILPCGDKYPLCLWGHFQISVLTSALCGPIYIFILKDEIDHQQGLGLSSTLADRIFWATIFQRYCCCCLFVNWTIFAYDTIVTIRIDRCAHGQCPHRRPKFTSREKANDEFMNASRVVWLGVTVTGGTVENLNTL